MCQNPSVLGAFEVGPGLLAEAVLRLFSSGQGLPREAGDERLRRLFQYTCICILQWFIFPWPPADRAEFRTDSAWPGITTFYVIRPDAANRSVEFRDS